MYNSICGCDVQVKSHPKLPRHLQGLMGEANMKFARGETDEAIKMCMEVVRLGESETST